MVEHQLSHAFVSLHERREKLDQQLLSFPDDWQFPPAETYEEGNDTSSSDALAVYFHEFPQDEEAIVELVSLASNGPCLQHAAQEVNALLHLPPVVGVVDVQHQVGRSPYTVIEEFP
jgi:hypothetical protein